MIPAAFWRLQTIKGRMDGNDGNTLMSVPRAETITGKPSTFPSRTARNRRDRHNGHLYNRTEIDDAVAERAEGNPRTSEGHVEASGAREAGGSGDGTR